MDLEVLFTHRTIPAKHIKHGTWLSVGVPEGGVPAAVAVAQQQQ